MLGFYIRKGNVFCLKGSKKLAQGCLNVRVCSGAASCASKKAPAYDSVVDTKQDSIVFVKVRCEAVRSPEDRQGFFFLYGYCVGPGEGANF